MLRENLAVARVGYFYRQLFSGRQRRLVLVEIAGDAFEMNDVTGLVNAALGEKENRPEFRLVFAGVVVNAETVERHGAIAAVNCDKMSVLPALSEDPSGIT